MSDQAFRTLVNKLRVAQRRFFKWRDNLDECKKLERAVDDALSQTEDIPFPEEPSTHQSNGR